MEENAGQGQQRPTSIVVWLVASAAAMLVGLESLLSPVAAPVAVAGAAGLLLLLVVVDAHLPHAILVAIFATLAGAQLVGIIAIEEPIRLFVVDLLALPLLIVAVFRQFARRRWPALSHHYLVLVAVSVLFTIGGLEAGNATFDALGTFRRICVYPAVYFAAVVATPTPATAARDFRRMAIVAGLAVSALAAVRIVSGEGYAHEYFEADDSVARFVSYIEAFAPILGVLVMMSESAGGQAQNRLRSLAAVWFLLLGLVVSNYRTIWAALGVGLGVWAVTAGRTARRALGPIILLVGVAGAASIAVLWITNPEALPIEKLSIENLQRTSSWRLGSWTRALEVFLESPILGSGFGYHHRFLYLTGEQLNVWGVSEGHTVHNDLLWLTTNGGVIIAALVVGFHVRWWRLCRAALGSAPLATPEGRILTAILGTHAAIVAVAMFQPVFSTPSAALAIYLTMGYGAALAHRLERRTEGGE